MNILTKSDLVKYADCVRFWQRGFDTNSIAKHLDLAEHVVANWIANFRDMGRQAA